MYLDSKPGISVESFGEIESSTIEKILKSGLGKINGIFSPAIIWQPQVISLVAGVIAKKQFIFKQVKIVKVKSLNSLKSPVSIIASPAGVQRIGSVKSWIPIPNVVPPLLSYSFTAYFEQMLSENSVRLETRVQIVLQVVSMEEAVVEMDPKTLFAQLNVERFVFVEGKPDVGLGLGWGLFLWISDGVLDSESALFCHDVSTGLKKTVMDEVICDDIVSVVVELTPDVEIKLDGLGHVLKDGFDKYNLDFRYLDFLPLTSHIKISYPKL